MGVIEDFQIKMAEHQTDLFNQMEGTYKRYCETYLEMSNTLNWVITLVTAQFYYFIDKLFDSSKCSSYLFFSLIGLFYFISILIYILYKTQYVKFKKTNDDLLFKSNSDLILLKDRNRFTKETIKEINKVIESTNEKLNMSQPLIGQINGEIDDKSFAKVGNEIDRMDVILKILYKIGMWVSISSLVFVPSYFILKYILWL